MAEYIERRAAIKSLLNDSPEQVYYSREDAADVLPMRHGRWVKIYETGEPAIEQHQVGVFCSRCMKMPKDRFTESDFCPNCGAKWMEVLVDGC